MRRAAVLASAVIAATAGLMLPASPASAYSLLGCKFTSGNLKWQPKIANSTYTTAATAAINDWNSTSTHFNFTQVSSGANVHVADGNYGATWMGNSFSGITLNSTQKNPVTNSCSGGTWDTTMVTWWNRHYTDSYTSAQRETIMVHEIGHALGLAHTASASSCSAPVMSVNIDSLVPSCGRMAPRQDDINGANALY
ncbi:hypothetical protein GCM10010112_83490 [Actinoplanes lobatus]|uniref:Putative Zn-dependent protease n=1 Tax=Actinoplanes lobatus TaxID=113568 RepID=A0A7W7HKQ4_9ACTN|nr:matrixin family metalloprotease [Actinoplanes lobatus]MBB4752306.1 putative Zn-dependent protease [Actinoplanes lobatus]GGN94309.1 hypothetical protein GCM10010112_83490 [Actinoplanes lobatus]GIE45991.1 hypothetical protein Alo02nite_88890 [Actinoplanes lobatus]